jgi:hypothetical protein
MKYVIVSGGVVSGLGKGVTASSVGVLLKNCGHRVTSIKIGEARASRGHGEVATQLQGAWGGPGAADPPCDSPAGGWPHASQRGPQHGASGVPHVHAMTTRACGGSAW